jgi:hypothetical protein
MNTEAGKEYFGILCLNKDCGMPIILGEVRQDQLDEYGRLQIQSPKGEVLKAICPHCRTESIFQIEQFRRFRAQAKEQLS